MNHDFRLKLYLFLSESHTSIFLRNPMGSSSHQVFTGLLLVLHCLRSAGSVVGRGSRQKVIQRATSVILKGELSASHLTLLATTSGIGCCLIGFVYLDMVDIALPG